MSHHDVGVGATALPDVGPSYGAKVGNAPTLRALAAALAFTIVILSALAWSKPAAPPGLVLPAFGTALGIAAAFIYRRRVSGQLESLDLFLLVGLFQVSAVPSFEVLNGPPDVAYRAIASDGQAAIAQLACVAFIVASCVGWSLVHRKRGVAALGPKEPSVRPLALVMCALGALGLAIRWRMALAALHGLTLPVQGGASLVGLVGTLTAPLLAVGSFFLVRSFSSTPARYLGVVVLIGPSLLALASYSLNRAAIIYPILAMALTYSRHSGHRKTSIKVLIVALAGLIAFLYIGQLRSQAQAQSAGIEQAPRTTLQYARDSAEVYLQSPYLVGIAFAQNTHSEVYSTHSLISSIMTPVPVLGRSLRDDSGSTLYNEAIYGNTGTSDQILPSYAEVVLSLGWPSLVIFGLLMGGVMRRLADRASRAQSAPTYYVLTFSGIWLAQSSIVSFSVLSQIVVYFVAPLVVVIALFRPKLRVRRHSQDTPVNIHSGVASWLR